MSGLFRCNLMHPKDDERNLFSAAFHMFIITLISMSMVDLTWFSITLLGSQRFCVPYLTLGQFFWFGYSEYKLQYEEYECINSSIVNMMRIVILLCFMAVIFATTGFFLDIMAPQAAVYRMARRYAVTGVSTMLWIMAIVTLSYYIIVLLQDAILKRSPITDFDISYGLGFYLVAFAGCIQSLGLVYTLLVPYKSSSQDDDRLINSNDDDHRLFHNATPPPPYYWSPPPPYTP